MKNTLFKLDQFHTIPKTELLAGLTTFFTMAYIVIIAPAILAQTGINQTEAFWSCCVLVALASILSGLFSNLPIALGPGLGFLTYFAYVVVNQLGYSWQTALGGVFIAGLIFLFITLTKIRQLILLAIPKSLGLSIAAGIGFFIGFIALKDVGLIVQNNHTIVALGDVSSIPIMLFFIGFFIIAVLDNRNVPGAMLIGIIVTALLGALFKQNHFDHFFALPGALPHSFLQLDFHGLMNIQSIPVIFTFLIIALFDSTGTLLGLAYNLERDQKQMQKSISKILIIESLVTMCSSLIGLTTLCPFIESASGIKAGGKTGMVALVVGAMFLLLIFFAPFAADIPSFATSAALFYISCLMIKPFAGVDWLDSSEFIPAVMTLLAIPLTFSIANGVGFGIICYAVLKLATGKIKAVHPMMWLLALIFLTFFLIHK